MILACGHTSDAFAVGESEHGHFPSRKEFLDNDGATRAAEYLGEHHIVERFERRIAVGTDDDAFTERESVRFQYDGEIFRFFYVSARASVFVESSVSRGGYAVALHEFLGKRLTAFDYRGVFAGTERLDAFRFEHVHKPRRQRVVGRDEYEVDGAFLRVSDYIIEFHSLDRHDLRYLRYAGVAGRA